MHRVFVVIALCVRLAHGAPPATGDATVEARKAFEAGQRAFRKHAFKEAIALFEQAYRIKPHPIIRFNLAKCAEEQGDVPGALRFYRLYLHDMPDAADREAVASSMTALERKLARENVQQLMVVVEPSDAVIAVDGKVLGPSPAFIELGKGDHRVTAESKGLEPLSRSFVMSTQKSLDLSFVMQPAPPPMPVLTPPPSTAATQPPAVAAAVTQPPPQKRSLVAPLSLTIAGGAALVVGAIFTALAASSWGQLHDAKWLSSHTFSEQKTLASAYSTEVVVGPSLLGVGLAAGVTGVLWWLLGSSPTPSAAPATGGAL